MINERRRWLYSKTVEPKIYEVGEVLKGDLYDSPDFDDPRTKCVTRPTAKSELVKPDDPEVYVQKKYPSQMNKDELMEYGNLLGLELTEDMKAREMRSAIMDCVKNAEDEDA